jgi:hypothetical protein
MPDSRRALYRVVYPLAERPTFDAGRRLYEIIDCSELGLHYEVKDGRLPALGGKLTGLVQFRRGVEIEVHGEVIRARGTSVVLALEQPGLPFAEIIAEQRHLRARGYTLKD